MDILSGGTIAPGDNIGTLTLGSGLTLESGSTNLFGEQNGSGGDLLQVQGNLTIQPNSTIAISVLGRGTVADHQHNNYLYGDKNRIIQSGVVWSAARLIVP